MEPRKEEMKDQKTPQVRKRAPKLLISIMTMLSAVLFLTVPALRADVEKSKSSNGGTLTKVRVNGRSAFAFLADGATNGSLTVSRDQITDTTALDFFYTARDPNNPDIVFVWQCAGEIPNSAFTINQTGSSARLAVTTPFPVVRYEVDLTTGKFTSTPWTPITFDLTWVQDGDFTIFERTERLQTFGPVKEYFNGAVSRVSASVSGTWDGHTMTTGSGELQDTRGNTVLREITVDPKP